MSSSDSHDDPPADSGPVLSRDALTPRGGFMARPGLKPPPRHAVVVRGGDAPLSGEIPVARSSFPPPPPSDPDSESLSDKATLRAIPAPRLPRISSVVFDEPSFTASNGGASVVAPSVFESAPPPSDAPLVSSIAPESSPAPSRRRGSGWTIVTAGAAGLVLGLVSVALTLQGNERRDGSPVAAAAPVSQPAEPALERAPKLAAPAPAPPPASSSAAATSKDRAAATQPRSAGAKKSIF